MTRWGEGGWRWRARGQGGKERGWVGRATYVGCEEAVEDSRYHTFKHRVLRAGGRLGRDLGGTRERRRAQSGACVVGFGAQKAAVCSSCSDDKRAGSECGAARGEGRRDCLHFEPSSARVWPLRTRPVSGPVQHSDAYDSFTENPSIPLTLPHSRASFTRSVGGPAPRPSRGIPREPLTLTLPPHQPLVLCPALARPHQLQLCESLVAAPTDQSPSSLLPPPPPRLSRTLHPCRNLSSSTTMASTAAVTPSKELNPLLAGACPVWSRHLCAALTVSLPPPLHPSGISCRAQLLAGPAPSPGNAAYLQSLATRPMLTKSLTSGSLSCVARPSLFRNLATTAGPRQEPRLLPTPRLTAPSFARQCSL